MKVPTRQLQQGGIIEYLENAQPAPTEEPTSEFFLDEETITLPPKGDDAPGETGQEPTMEPTYLTFSPTKKKEAEPTFFPTYITEEPTESKNEPTAYPTYLTDEPTESKKEPTAYPTYFTDEPTDSPSTGHPTFAPTLTHAPTVIETTTPPVPTFLSNAPSPEDSFEDSMSETKEPEGPPTEKPTDQPVAGPTQKPTEMPTMQPTKPTSVIKEEKYRNKFVGFQSDWGPAHPGSMTYDFTRNSIYVTGTMFAPVKSATAEKSDFQRSTCFVGELPIADIEEWVVDEPPRPLRAEKNFVVPDSFDEREVMACHAIYYNDQSKTDDVLYVASVTEMDSTARNGKISAGLETYTRDRFDPHWMQSTAPEDLTGTEAKVRWPVVMTERDENSVIVLTVASDDPLLTEEYIENGDANNKKNSKNSLLPPGVSGADPSKYAVPKRGSNFFMNYEVYKRTADGRHTVVMGQEFHTAQVNGENGDIFPTGIAKTHGEKYNHLIAGHMRGLPPRAFGMQQPVGTEDYDGFVAGLHFGVRPSFVPKLNNRFDSIETNPPLDDFLHGICLPPPTKDGETAFYYVVGSSYGTMPAGYSQSEINTNILKGPDGMEDGNKVNRLSAWVSKVDMNRKNDRAVVWTTQLFATEDNISLEGGMTEGFGCHVVDADKSMLYIAGTVYNGGTMDSAQKSAGGDDVWVAQLNSNDGSIRWITQIGSSGDEKLARTNGIESDLNGHAIIFGETTGELYRSRRGEKKNKDDGSSTDIFITTLDKDTGISESTIEGDRLWHAEMDALIGASVAAVLVMLCCCIGFVLKWRRAKRYAAKDADGVLNTGNISAFQEGDDEEEAFAGGPPKKAFKDSLSDDGSIDEEDNGDAGGGLSKFV